MHRDLRGLDEGMNDDQGEDLLSAAYRSNQPKRSLAKTIGLRILGGIACSFAVYLIMHIGFVVVVLRWTCEIGGYVLGRPPVSVKAQKGLESLLDENLPVSGEPTHQTIHDRIVEKKKQLAPAIKENPVVEKIVEVKETAKAAGEVKEKATQAVTVVKETGEKIAETGGKVVNALQETGGNVKVATVGTVESLANWREKRRERAEKEEREAIEAWAATHGLETDPNWSMPMLRAKALEHKKRWDAQYGPNAMCPHCRFRFRTTTRAGENVRCHHCFAVISARTARSLGSYRGR